MKEVYYYPIIMNFFTKKGYLCKLEVNCVDGARSDVTCYKKETDELIAIEVKTGRVRDGIGQALYYLRWSDKAYVASASKITEKDIDIIKAIGLGVLKLTESNVEEIVKPKKSTIMNLDIKRRMVGEIMPKKIHIKNEENGPKTVEFPKIICEVLGVRYAIGRELLDWAKAGKLNKNSQKKFCKSINCGSSQYYDMLKLLIKLDLIVLKSKIYCINVNWSSEVNNEWIEFLLHS